MILNIQRESSLSPLFRSTLCQALLDLILRIKNRNDSIQKHDLPDTGVQKKLNKKHVPFAGDYNLMRFMNHCVTMDSLIIKRPENAYSKSHSTQMNSEGFGYFHFQATMSVTLQNV